MLTLELYAKALGTGVPWRVLDIEVDHEDGEIRVFIGPRPGTERVCPICGNDAAQQASTRQQWRMPDPTNFDTVLLVDVPLFDCPIHGPVEAPQPWSRAGSGFHPTYSA